MHKIVIRLSVVYVCIFNFIFYISNAISNTEILNTKQIENTTAVDSISNLYNNHGLQNAYKYMPLIADTIKEILGKELSQRFFKKWQLQDFLAFILKMKAYLKNKNNINNQESQTPIYDNYINSNAIYGIFGEIFGSIMLKESKILNLYNISLSKAIFVSDLQLDPPHLINHKNIPINMRSRHDGIIFQLNKKRELIIIAVFEAKMGGGYIVDQGEKVLERWKRYGIYINSTLFPPYKIFVRIPKPNGKYKEVNIRHIHKQEFEGITVLATVKLLDNINTKTQYQPLVICIGDNLLANTDARDNYDFEKMFHMISDRLSEAIHNYNGNIKDLFSTYIDTISLDLLHKIAHIYFSHDNIDNKQIISKFIELLTTSNMQNIQEQDIPYFIMLNLLKNIYTIKQIKTLLDKVNILSPSCSKIFTLPILNTHIHSLYLNASSF